ncbi:Gfo/Idh/MocA family protein [Candidatus Neomarinimicrobiota bacterium]
MTAIRLGIIGSGFMAETHSVSIQRYVKNAELAGLGGGSRAMELAVAQSVEHFAAVEELVSSNIIDAVIITSPHKFHYEHALMCAAAGKHVLLEKPMAVTIEECQQIADAFNNANLRLMVAFTQRYRESNLKALEILRSGELGNPVMMQEWALTPGGPGIFPPWQLEPENLGLLFGYGVHNLDKLRWLLDSEISTVSGQTIQTAAGVETSTQAIISMSNGLPVSLWTGANLPRPGFPGGAYRSYIVCEQGLLDIDGYGAVQVADWETVFVQPAIDWQGDGKFAPARMNSFNGQNQEFVNSIIDGREPAITGEDGLRAVSAALAIYQSAVENRQIQLQL